MSFLESRPPPSCSYMLKLPKAKQENIKIKSVNDSTQEIKSCNASTFSCWCMKTQLCAAAAAADSLWLFEACDRKEGASCLIGRAKLVTCRRYEHKGCEEWERHADNKIQRGEIKWKNVTLLTEPFPLGVGTGCDLFHGQWRHGSAPFNPLTDSFFFFCLSVLGLGAGGAGEVEVEHGLGHPQWFYRAHHTAAAPSQRQAADGPQTHSDIHSPLRHR